MKVVLQAIIGSISIHVIYVVVMMLVGYIKTKNYKPDIESAWDKVETLQNEVEFVSVTPPHFYVLSFLGVSVICGIVILSYEKLMN
ncbi:hypothetical protein [Peribacillus simplex]|uniref:Menaquinol-cytochrome c reductase cytochrome b subunit n=1 Tax=Peribacillus simplex TaxID=1478 RepID=A0A9W4PJV8_9BACI|nr:hypothetical protein [Peribacillus simplex]MDR4927754.1 hypothetical protein [Peribacillus simplex]WHX92963.1 hypothetical protein QNH50_09000 [Peribacillus simplex]CAH0318461.1 hypothetical protein SRABI133_05233 [Peribacillus simplex]